MVANGTHSTREQPESIAAGQSSAELESKRSAQARTENKEAKEKPSTLSKRLEGFSPIFEALVTISTVAGLAFIGVQSCFMRESNRLTQESNALTRAALEDSRKQYQEARADSADDAKRAEERFNATLKAAQDAAAVDQQLSRQSLAESRRTLELSQRAYIVVDRIEVSEALPWRSTVYLRNTGHVPATEVRWSLAFADAPTSLFLPRLEVAPGGRRYNINEPRTVIGGGLTLPVIVRGHTTFSEAVVEGREIPFFQGVVGYSDGFGRDRRTRFCFYFHPFEPHYGWRPCFKFDEAE